MSVTKPGVIDPALTGRWCFETAPERYEIHSDGTYRIGEPPEPIRFEQAGLLLRWGDRTLRRSVGQGETLIGSWTDIETGDFWVFRPDGSYSLLFDGATDRGHWDQVVPGPGLRLIEDMAQLSTNGAEIRFTFRDGGTASFGYTAQAQSWCLHDPLTWKEIARFKRDPSRRLTNEGCPPRL